MKYTIKPYLIENVWCFDDELFFIYKEPFVEGMSEMINDILKLKGINSEDNFEFVFSNKPMNSEDIIILSKLLERDGGAEYKCNLNGMIGWLCPVVCTYFQTPPESIYAKVIKIVK